MAREIDTTEIVWLSVLRGKSAQESRAEAEKETGRTFRQKYINDVRSRANRLIRERCRQLEGPAMSFAVLRRIVDISARSDQPLDEAALRQLADAARYNSDDVIERHQERHEQHMRAQVRGIVVDSWAWNPYGR